PGDQRPEPGGIGAGGAVPGRCVLAGAVGDGRGGGPEEQRGDGAAQCAGAGGVHGAGSWRGGEPGVAGVRAGGDGGPGNGRGAVVEGLIWRRRRSPGGRGRGTGARRRGRRGGGSGRRRGGRENSPGRPGEGGPR